MKRRQKSPDPTRQAAIIGSSVGIPGFRVLTWCAYDFRNAPTDGRKHCWSDKWVLDCFFTPGIVKVKGGRWEKREPFILHLYPPGTSYQEKTWCWGDVERRVWVQFICTEDVALGALTDNTLGYARFRDPARRIVDRIPTMAEQANRNPRDSFWEIQSQGLVICRLLTQSRKVEGNLYTVPTSDEISEADPLVTAIMDYMAAHLSSRITLEGLARVFHASAGTIRGHFAKVLKESPNDALLRLRMVRAKALLAEGSSLESIAVAVGFYDAFHFSHAFKKSEGVSPRAFRDALASRVSSAR